MKKLSMIVVALLLISMVTYGEDSGWLEQGDFVRLRQLDDIVGIGTANPEYKLDVRGQVQSRCANPYIRLYDTNTVEEYHSQYIIGRDGYLQVQAMKGNNTWKTSMQLWPTIQYFPGNVGIDTTSPQYKLHVKGDIYTDIASDSNYALTVRNRSGDGLGLDVFAGYGNTGGTVAKFRTELGIRMIIQENGNVGIGTENPQSKLAVKGKITAQEVEITLDGWSDFVFADNYQLMSLGKLEQHIEEEKSLPGIPKEKEVVENGINLGEMQAKLLEKVEELTLYMIDQNKELIELKKENEELKRRIAALEN